MGKGEETRRAILDQAIEVVSTVGLDKLTIGGLASATGMSKSGLFAHFKSKEQLQLTVLTEARERFIEMVVRPAFKRPRGEPRIRALFELTLSPWEASLPGGCIFHAVTAELDDQPGPVRDYLVEIQRAQQQMFRRAAELAVEVGDFRPDLDIEHFAFELTAITSAYHYFARLLSDPKTEDHARRAFDALLERSH